jgi:hypothetical protein
VYSVSGIVTIGVPEIIPVPELTVRPEVVKSGVIVNV